MTKHILARQDSPNGIPRTIEAELEDIYILEETYANWNLALGSLWIRALLVLRGTA